MPIAAALVLRSHFLKQDCDRSASLGVIPRQRDWFFIFQNYRCDSCDFSSLAKTEFLIPAFRLPSLTRPYPVAKKAHAQPKFQRELTSLDKSRKSRQAGRMRSMILGRKPKRPARMHCGPPLLFLEKPVCAYAHERLGFERE